MEKSLKGVGIYDRIKQHDQDLKDGKIKGYTDPDGEILKEVSKKYRKT